MIHPESRLTIVLAADAKKPDPATFYARTVSCGEAMELSEMFNDDKIKKQNGKQRLEALKKLCDMIEGFVRGWDNVTDASGKPVRYGGSVKLRDVLSMGEMAELAGRIVGGS